jgi:hypothetical protein
VKFNGLRDETAPFAQNSAQSEKDRAPLDDAVPPSGSIQAFSSKCFPAGVFIQAFSSLNQAGFPASA